MAKTIESFTPSKQSFMKKQSLISNVGASTRIENAVLTDIEIEWIDTTIETEPHQEFAAQKAMIENKLSKDKRRSIEEVAGFREAAQVVFELSNDFYPLRESDLKGFHRETLKYHAKANHYLGNYKKQFNTVIETNHETGQTKVVLKTADPGLQTDTAMQDLITWYNATIKASPWVVPVACEFVFRFLAIHPFQDGNGRLSRLLFHLALLTAEDACYKTVTPYLALDRSIEQTRHTYYLVLRKCSEGHFKTDPSVYKIGYFFDYMTDCLNRSLENVIYFAQKYDHFIELSETAVKILNCFKEAPEISFKTGHLVHQLGIPRRTTIYAIKQLEKAGFIKMLGKGAASRYLLVF